MNPTLPNHPTTQPNGDGSVPIPELRDILLPQDVTSYWIAPGWLLSLFIVICVLAGLTYWGLWLWQKNAYRRQALKELQQWRDQQNTELTPQKLQFLSNLLKRVALVASKPSNLSKLHSQYWQNALKQLAPNCLSSETIDLLSQGQYQPQVKTTATLDQVYRECQQWLKNYRPNRELLIEENHA